MPGTAPHLQGGVQGQHAAPCFQQRCVLCTATAKPYAGPWLSSRFHPQHKNVLELAAKADLAAVALRLAWGAEFCQGAARLREEMTFYESKFHFCVELCPGRLRLSQIGPIILPTSLTCCTSPTWFLAAPTPVGVCGQAVPCAPAEQLADVLRRCQAKDWSALCSHERPPSCCTQNSLGFCTGRATGALVPQRARAVCRAYMCVCVWEVLGRNRSWAEHAAGPGHQALCWRLLTQPRAMDTPALGMASRSSLISCIRTTSPCSSSLLASVISWKRLSVRPTSSTPMSTWCPTTWTSMTM